MKANAQLQKRKAAAYIVRLVYICPGRQKLLYHGIVSSEAGSVERSPAILFKADYDVS